MRALGWIVLIGALLGGGAPAEAMFCKTKTGAVVLRDACRAKETALDVPLVGPGGAPGAPGAAGATGLPPLHLIDATGALVGPVVNLSWYVQTPAEVLAGAPLIFALVRNDAVGGAALLGVDYTGLPSGMIYWTGATCTGEAFIPGDALMPVLQVIGGTMFVPGAARTAQAVGALEQVNASNGCTSVTPRGGCCQVSANTLATARLLTSQSFATLGIELPLRPVAP